MKILITGSNGCVGNALQAICDGDWNFISREDCELEDREFTIEFFKQQETDCIVHLASYVPGFYNIDRVASFATNVRINENVLEAAHLAGVQRGLFCYSVNMFSEEVQSFPMDEGMIFDSHIGGPFAGYGYAKRMLAMQCRNYNEQHGRQYFGIIPCNIYGPSDNMKSGRLIPNLITKFAEAKRNETDVLLNGSGKPMRQFIYSADLAAIIRHLVLEYSGTKDIICCGDKECSIAELAAHIGASIGFNGKIEFDLSKKDGVLRKTVSNKYLKELLPDFAFTSLSNGLEQTIGSMGLL